MYIPVDVAAARFVPLVLSDQEIHFHVTFLRCFTTSEQIYTKTHYTVILARFFREEIE